MLDARFRSHDSGGATRPRSSSPIRAVRAPRRDRGERQRDQHVVAGERQAEEAPRRFVAADHAGVLDQVAQPAGRTEVGDRSRAVLRTFPPLPFDAGVIGGEAGVPEHRDGDGEEREQHHLARRADRHAEQHHGRERDRGVVGVTLLQAERAWPVAEHVLEEIGAEDGGEPDHRDGHGGRHDRLGADAVEGKRAHARLALRHDLGRIARWIGAPGRTRTSTPCGT